MHAFLRHATRRQRGWIRQSVALLLSIAVNVLVIASLTQPRIHAAIPRPTRIWFQHAAPPVMTAPPPQREATSGPQSPRKDSAPQVQNAENPPENSAQTNPEGTNATTPAPSGPEGPAEPTGSVGQQAPTSTGPTNPEPAPPAIDRDRIISAYRQQVIAAISAHKSYPATARRLGKQGNVQVRFRVAANGVVSEAAVASSSGVEALDRSAVDAVNAASPLPSIPVELGESSLVLSLTIMFLLN